MPRTLPVLGENGRLKMEKSKKPQTAAERRKRALAKAETTLAWTKRGHGFYNIVTKKSVTEQPAAMEQANRVKAESVILREQERLMNSESAKAAKAAKATKATKAA